MTLTPTQTWVKIFSQIFLGIYFLIPNKEFFFFFFFSKLYFNPCFGLFPSFYSFLRSTSLGLCPRGEPGPPHLAVQWKEKLNTPQGQYKSTIEKTKTKVKLVNVIEIS